MSRTWRATGLRADFKSFIFVMGFHQDAVVLVGLEHEVGGGGEDAGEGGEFFGDEEGDILEVFAGDEEEEVEGAGHEVEGLDFGEFTDAVGNVVEAAFTLGGDFDFDDGGDEVDVELVVVDDGLVAADDAAFFVFGDAAADFVGGEAEHAGEVLGGFEGVLFEEFEEFVHGVTCGGYKEADCIADAGGWQGRGSGRGNDEGRMTKYPRCRGVCEGR